MSNFQTAIVDADFIKYAAAACGEKRSILVINNETGDEYTFKTRTEFYGRGKVKNGGWLGEYNLAKDLNLSAEDFTIQDVQTKLDFSNCTNVVDYQIKSALAGLGTNKYKAFIGRGDSFRVERSTLLKYKGQRTSLLKPLYLKDVEEYLIEKYNAEIVTGIENDDRCVMECYKQPDNILLAAEKDFYSCPVKYYNAVAKVGTINCDTFGKLSLNEKKEVKGYGRLHLYYQTCAQDDSDNYKAHCMSDVAWGEQSAYKALVNCKNDREAWKAIEGVFKHLYPEPKEVVGWRGDTILIDWAYVLNECFDMSRMHRFENDFVVATDVLNSFK